MGFDGSREFLERINAAIERIDGTLARQAEMLERQAESSQRQERSFQRLMHEAEGREARAVARDERLIERFDRSERRIISALGDVNIGMEQSIERLKDMKDAIQANRTPCSRRWTCFARRPPPPERGGGGSAEPSCHNPGCGLTRSAAQ